MTRLDNQVAVDRQAPCLSQRVQLPSPEPFLRIPPFPGSRLRQFSPAYDDHPVSTDELGEAVRRLRVGGSFWAAKPKLPQRYVLLRDPALVGATKDLPFESELVCWTQQVRPELTTGDVALIGGECDPWHMLASADAVVLKEGDEVALVAALLKVPIYSYDPRTGSVARSEIDAEADLARAVGRSAYLNPFSNVPMSPLEAVELSGFWRGLIDSNNGLGGCLGFAFWKQDHVAPLLWNGKDAVRFVRSAAEAPAGQAIAVWRARASSQALADLERASIPLVEVEDGFLRSQGLGADCIPPMSITVDRLGAHFDPSAPSGLEVLLQSGMFDGPLLERARDLRKLIIDAGLGKYERSAEILERPAANRTHILVPGQVEDDRAVKTGGCGLTSNLELLKRVRAQAPEAYIIYKPHPDVVAGHRRGDVLQRDCLRYADQVADDLAIGPLISMVDEVHVNTSLAGFEALLRAKQVTTYGVPFYAGWGLTHDLGPVPARRTARRSLDELVAATLLLYPRYLDPMTGLPCPAEIVVARLCADRQRDPNLLVGARRLQGKFMRRLRSLVQ